MTDNTIISNQLASILTKYSLGELASPIEQLTNGWTNLTFKFHTKPSGKAYILRQYLPSTFREVNLENIQFELNFIAHLFSQLQLPVAAAIDPPGIFTFDNRTYCAIFPFIRGIKYLDTPQTPTRQLWQTVAIARFLGRMHSDQPEMKSITRRSVNFLDVKYEIVFNCDEFQEEYPDLYKRIRVITDEYLTNIPLTSDKTEQNRYQNELEKDLPIGYIHADLHDDNVIFSPTENKLAAVLDFDDMYIGPFLIDFTMALCLWCSVGSKLQSDYVKEFLGVYENERRMLITEKEWQLMGTYCYFTVLNQILFTIEAENDAKPKEEMINELLLPVEFIGKEMKLLFSCDHLKK
ncbi:unnamed protein product [Adineta ricciae]|uniref:Aminoglycoside phosphotransferase domain-containing protein n=1 Tax=Adineta ricciae TaxID=249248 RepID=A0A815FYD9_ADIRI|nr:unnamed protein product [Adineta ricciae]CAF1639691.1 unnamed protein product [Adineta ricciae]